MTFKKCQMQGCHGTAEFEAWFRVRDNVTGKPTGLIQRFEVCRSCVKMSIPFEDGKNPDLDAFNEDRGSW